MAARKQIRDSLMGKLREMGADVAHFEALVDDYMRLLGVKEDLLADIRKRGVVYDDVASTGVKMKKNNPSVKEAAGISRQMLLILRELGIRTCSAGGGDGFDCDL